MGTVLPACCSHQSSSGKKERESGVVVYLRLQVACRPLHLVIQRGGLGQSGHDQQTEQDGHHCSQRKSKSFKEFYLLYFLLRNNLMQSSNIFSPYWPHGCEIEILNTEHYAGSVTAFISLSNSPVSYIIHILKQKANTRLVTDRGYVCQLSRRNFE